VNLGIHVGVSVNEAWCDDVPVSVYLLAATLADAADLRDPPGLHSHVGME
jgi:hypothetical protein